MKTSNKFEKMVVKEWLKSLNSKDLQKALKAYDWALDTVSYRIEDALDVDQNSRALVNEWLQTHGKGEQLLNLTEIIENPNKLNTDLFMELMQRQRETELNLTAGNYVLLTNDYSQTTAFDSISEFFAANGGLTNLLLANNELMNLINKFNILK